ncbi:hypothetical protein BCR44DRAFT_84494 [Catenaria anguillulae PL171]|uniref:Uncharacterized protein n=1 Tax=Catenaria anguillulae PL171 TaxID=765915 RepID=A0A1Y2HBK6_9FUNG|nr:hypothetical protein BCR44DRAFT_84494 [Catenaria anguillulae PL171]
MGFVWSTMESTLERDAQAVLADLASRVARHSGASSPVNGDEQDEPAGLREMRAETEAMERGLVAGRNAPRHKLAVINRRLVLNVNAWCVRWISMMQHPRKAATPGDQAMKKPTVLSSEAIDLALYRILGNLDGEKKAAWDTLLHQILKCTNKWLGIIRAMVRIMDSLMEHEQLLDVMADLPLLPGTQDPADGDTSSAIQPPSSDVQEQEGIDFDPPSESSANVD